MSKTLWIVAALLILGIKVPAAHADSFDISWSGTFGSGSVTVAATNDSGGEFLITSLTGTQGGLSVSLEATDTYGANDNFIFPAGGPSSPCASSVFGSVSASSDLDNCGFSFTDGTNSYNIFAPYTDVVPGTTYFECSSAVVETCEGLAPNIASELTSFRITPAVTSAPEPPSLILLSAGLLILIGMGLRKRAAIGALV
jgi:hypothetical protein